METLAAWYYADANHQQLGPLTRAALVEAVERGAVNAATLVWRDGLAGWQPLAKVAGEVGLHGHEPPVFAALESTGSASANDICYAGFLKRWAALTIDSLILFVPTMVPAFALGTVAALFGGSDQHPMWARAFGYVAWIALAPVYYAGFESSRRQATFGKRAIGIKVTDLAGGRIGFGRALTRSRAGARLYCRI